jgi:hypothetical protein
VLRLRHAAREEEGSASGAFCLGRNANGKKHSSPQRRQRQRQGHTQATSVVANTLDPVWPREQYFFEVKVSMCVCVCGLISLLG